MVEWKYSSTIPNFDVGEWSASRPCRFTPGKQPRSPLYRRLGAPQSWSRHYGKEKNILSLPGMEPASSIVLPVAQSLYRLNQGHAKMESCYSFMGIAILIIKTVYCMVSKSEAFGILGRCNAVLFGRQVPKFRSNLLHLQS
jgi:hypothetical protein